MRASLVLYNLLNNVFHSLQVSLKRFRANLEKVAIFLLFELRVDLRWRNDAGVRGAPVGGRQVMVVGGHPRLISLVWTSWTLLAPVHACFFCVFSTDCCAGLQRACIYRWVDTGCSLDKCHHHVGLMLKQRPFGTMVVGCGL